MPALATEWKPSDDGLTWTFTLRDGVTFTDGEPFDAAAVCANFDRWYNFTGRPAEPVGLLLLVDGVRRLRQERGPLGAEEPVLLVRRT